MHILSPKQHLHVSGMSLDALTLTSAFVEGGTEHLVEALGDAWFTHTDVLGLCLWAGLAAASGTVMGNLTEVGIRHITTA